MSAVEGKADVAPDIGEFPVLTPKETSRTPSLDDHKCYSFAIKSRAASGLEVR
jgi:hypothetical protein